MTSRLPFDAARALGLAVLIVCMIPAAVRAQNASDQRPAFSLASSTIFTRASPPGARVTLSLEPST